MYHTLFLLLAILTTLSDKTKKIILTLGTFGHNVISGSIYLLATNDAATTN
jgi:uncharacterized membrane protein YgdD (TMEM256/DUF423 family)